MSLQDILKKIAADSAAQVSEIDAQTSQDKKAIDQQAAQQLKSDLTTLAEKTDQALVRVDEKTQSMGRRENQAKRLEAKRKVLDQAMDRLLASLEQSDDRIYTEICQALLRQLNLQSGVVRAPQSRVKLMEGLVSGVEVKADRGVRGGFIVETGGQMIDNQFSSLVGSELRDELETYFSHQLKLV